MSSDHEWPVEVWAEIAEARRKDPWNRVYEFVRNGKWSRERAEAWAKERGHPSFKRRPASEKHNPMVAMDWTLAMATAWIIWRTPQAVQECMEAYLAECADWVPLDHRLPARRGTAPLRHVRGFELKDPNTPSPAEVLSKALVDRALGGVTVVEPEQAPRELRDALRKGDLVAKGGQRADPIEKTRWSALSPFTGPRHQGPHDAIYGGDGEVQFSRVTVERETVLEIWQVSDGEKRTSGLPAGSMKYKTGSPGRPGSIHLVVGEFERRIEQGKVLHKVALEARALAEWLFSVHPDAAPCGAENIENKIRERYRELYPKGPRGQKMKLPN